MKKLLLFVIFPSLCFSSFAQDSPQPIIRRSAERKAIDISAALPAGQYRLIISPAVPQLDNTSEGPRHFEVTISYSDDGPILHWGETKAEIISKNGIFTFTIPPSKKGSFTTTQVYSGFLPSEENRAGQVVGRRWDIHVWPSKAEESLFSLEKIK